MSHTKSKNILIYLRSFSRFLRSHSRISKIFFFYSLPFILSWRIVSSTASPGEPVIDLIEKYTSEVVRYTSPERLSGLNDWNGDIVWRASWVLDSLDSMYEATRDEKYMEFGRRLIQAIFDGRDDKRGITDFSGEISVFWSNKKYGLGKLEVKNEDGEAFLILESTAYAAANKTLVSVWKESPRALTIIARNPQLKSQEKYVHVRYDELTQRINTVLTA